MSEKKFSTTIKRKWWAEKMKDHEQKGYFWEWKEDSKHWYIRLSAWAGSLDWPKDGVFLVGSEPHRVKIYDCVFVVKSKAIKDYGAEKYMSEIKTNVVFGLKCRVE